MKDRQLPIARQLDFITVELVHRLKVITTQGEPLTGVQFFTLRLLAQERRLKVTDIATCLGVTLSAVTGLINRLHRLGLVDRRQDRGDRRIVWIVLTEKGQACIDMLCEKRAEKLARLLAELPDRDLEKLQEILQRISIGLD